MKVKMNHMLKTSLAIWLIATLTLLAACGGTVNNNKESAAPSVAPSASPSAETGAAYPLTVTDAMDTKLTFEQAPEKIVTLVPSETEVVFAVGAGKQVVGVDQYSNYPEEANDIEKIGDMTTNIEAVVKLNPDLVLASSSMNGDAIAKLRELNIPVFASDPKTYGETIAHIEAVGQILNRVKDAETVAGHMRDVMNHVMNAVKDAPAKKVYLEFSPGYTAGSGTFLDELLTMAGGTNVAGSKEGWYEVSAEEIVKQNPEIIIYPDMKVKPNPIVAAIDSRAGWNVIDAVKNKQVIAVVEDPLVRVGPRLADGLLELAKAVHPDLVK
ncbi:ABC transporter substrate-binding protein [Paenibacillus algorifonticola]|uniref:ABC transporter substrate-binding protein n=1 Tax=Paenibacillus algorifonticola TaxID=684063 RepID=UPI003D28D073